MIIGCEVRSKRRADVRCVRNGCIGGAWILITLCEVMSKLIMSSLGRAHAVKHNTKNRQHSFVLCLSQLNMILPDQNLCLWN